MKPIKIMMVLTITLMIMVGICPITGAQEILPDFPGSKILVEGPNPVGIGKEDNSSFTYEINLNVDNSANLLDVVPAEFDVVGLEASCGTAASFEGRGSLKPKKGKGKGKANFKLNPDFIIWNLGDCENQTEQSLTVVIETERNPGHGRRQIDYCEPTECGPLYLNDGAVLINQDTREQVTEYSNSLSVSTCLAEGDEGCIDKDADGWSIDCGDCNDEVKEIYPGAAEICDDGIDNDCDGDTDCDDVDCLLDIACIL